MSRRKTETSKLALGVSGCLFGVHLLISCVLIYLGRGDGAVALMQACSPVYLAVAAGYFGKAGVENVTKIKRLADELSGAESETSNG